MNIAWSSSALRDLNAVRGYIAQDNPSAADRVAREIIRSVKDLLSDHPHIGRPGRIPGTRELVIPNTPYIVPYRVWSDRIQIIRVFHSARRWPDQF